MFKTQFSKTINDELEPVQRNMNAKCPSRGLAENRMTVEGSNNGSLYAKHGGPRNFHLPP
jgi:hypothetical protein